MSSYTFGPFQLDEEARVLSRNGEPVPLTARVFDTLVVLVRNHGCVIDKEQLMREIWPNTVVEEANLTQNVSTLRRALGDSAKEVLFIATVAGRGYSFVAPVVETPKADLRRMAAQRVIVQPRWGKWVTIGGLLVVCVGLAGWFLASNPGVHSNSPITRILPFTTYPGVEMMPAFSPDGNQIAYVRGEEGTTYFNIWKPIWGHTSIYTKLIGAGTELRLTKGEGTYSHPAWSPDGKYIAFARNSPGASGYFVVSALGGPERRIADLVEAPCAGLTWTPNGESLVISERSERRRTSPLIMLSRETGARRIITTTPAENVADIDPIYSPDGQWLAFIRVSDPDSAIYLLPTNGGPLRRLVGQDWIEHLAWTPDSREIVFSAGCKYSHLWRVALRGGAPVAITPEDQSARMPAIARDPARLAYVLAAQRVNLWSIDLAGPDLAKAGTPKELISSTRLQLDPRFSPDGSKVAFASNRSGAFQLWVADDDGRNPTRITHIDNDVGGSPDWSPDGTEIAFDTQAWMGGKAEILAIRSDGGSLRRITTHPGNDVVPNWSHDGKWIYFTSDRTGDFQIWKVSSTGESPSSPAIQITSGGGIRAVESFDGNYLYFSKGRGKPGLWRRSLRETKNAQEEPVLPLLREWGWWALARDRIYYFEEQGPATLLKEFDPSHRTTRLVNEIRGPVFGAAPSIAVRFDGRRIIYSKIDSDNSDIMLVENFR